MSNTAKNNQNVVNPTKIITGICRLSYANIWQAKSINGGTPKFSTSVLIPKSDAVTISRVKKAIQAAYEEGESKLKGNGKSVPPLATLKTPMRDGDVERPDDPAYEGHWFVNANSGTAPGVVDINRQPIIDTSEIYSGVYARVSLSFYGKALWKQGVFSYAHLTEGRCFCGGQFWLENRCRGRKRIQKRPARHQSDV